MSDNSAQFLRLYMRLDAPSRRIAERILSAIEYAGKRGWPLPKRIDFARQLGR